MARAVGLPAPLNRFDLNLLYALDALLAERSVTRAASRVGITQGAMSHALARLRTLTGDELLVRKAGQMVPTPRGAALVVPVRRILDDSARAFSLREPFDPTNAQVRIAVASSDYVGFVLLPRVLARLRALAPAMEVRISSPADDIRASLSSGAVDLAITSLRASDEGPGLFVQKLFDECLSCVVRRGHPLEGRELTIEQFADASHALVAPHGNERCLVDDALAELGLHRHIAITMPHFLLTPHLLASGDLVALLPERIAEAVADSGGLTMLAMPPPLRSLTFVVSAIWHERTHDDPTLGWVRSIFVQEGTTLGRQLVADG